MSDLAAERHAQRIRGAAAARHALVIGNTDGIGLALTRKLLASGWAVSGVSRRPSSLDDHRYEHTVLDVTAPEYAQALAALLADRPPVVACFYCAGIGNLFDPDDLALEAQTFAVNLVGAALTVQTVVPAMLAAGRGHIVGLSSLADDGPSPEAPSYAASKAGLTAYLVSLALALRPRGVHVTAVRLGFVDTKMAKARVRPFMVSADQAADAVLRCLRTRTMQLTYPKRMGALVRVLRWMGALRVWAS
jgi:NAD(P)-dependent dehydrogenase (short-subunit alcohol dehydrogenase family)